jgi:Enterochelin esterase and related enzymes
MSSPRHLLFGLAASLSLLLAACASTLPTETPTVTPRTTAVTSVPPTTQPTPTCRAEGGTTQRVKFQSPVMGETLTFTIYLPPCYDANLAGGYPVIYLFHGQNMDDTYWPDILGMTPAADVAIRQGSPAFLMVFPEEVHDWDIPADSKFGDAIIDDLIPYVEAHYNVCTLRQCRAIGGISRGGGWALHLGLTNLEMFGAIGAHSPGWFAGDLYRVQNLLKTYPASDFPRIYMDRGDGDYLRDSIDLYEQNLTDTGVAHIYKISPGLHNEAYWQSQMPAYLAWYVQDFTGLN